MTDATHTPEVSSPDEGEETAITPDVSTEPEVAPTAELLGLTLPEDPQQAMDLLLRELHEARQESTELLMNLQRVTAEFDNYRKRTERDQVENVRRASQRTIEALLPTLDSLDAALAIEASSETEARMLDGLRNTEELLLEALKNEDFDKIDALNAPFDPALHEAVSISPGDGEQIVQQELRKGYVMRGRVIRPSLVIVGYA